MLNSFKSAKRKNFVLYLERAMPKIIPVHSLGFLDFFFSEMKDFIYKKENRLSGCCLGRSNLKDLIFTELFQQ